MNDPRHTHTHTPMCVAFYITFIYVWKLGTVFPQPNCSMTQLTHSDERFERFSRCLFFFRCCCCCCCLSLFNFSFALILFCFISFELLASEELPTECAATNYAPRHRSLFCSYSARHFNYLQINSAHCVYEARLPLLNTIILLLVWRYKSQD